MIDLRRRDGRLLRVGHRGAAALAPENTLEALRLARRARLRPASSSTCTTLDGTLVLVHDRPTGPVSGLPTLDEALELLAADGRRACTST